jgi:hypothetical protein
LTSDALSRIDQAMTPDAAAETRYDAAQMAMLDSERGGRPA